jgi:hypothetical protein
MNDVNRKIAELCGWKFDLYKSDLSYKVTNPTGEPVLKETMIGRINKWGESELSDIYPDYQHSLDAAMAAAGELLNYGLCIFLNPDDPHITYKNGKRDEFGDLWTRLPVKSNDPSDIAAAICEAILQAHGISEEAGE